ncbi:POK18 protein, partial [Agelaius phoeniceus]|nr:POK18 protein [Agelaius phoeniceus]
ITGRTVVPQPLSINEHPQTLRDTQQLCGVITWIRPLLGLTTEELAPLFDLLRGDGDLASPRSLTPEACEALERVTSAIKHCQAHRTERSLPLSLGIFDDTSKTALIIIIEWLFLLHQPHQTVTTPPELVAKLIIKGRHRLRTLAACNPACMYLPYTLEQLDSLLQTNEHLQISFDSSPGKISIHYPKHRLFKDSLHFAPKSDKSKTPLKNIMTEFTDGPGKSHQSVFTWRDPDTQKWESDTQVVEGSPQTEELAAAVRAFRTFQQPFNSVTGSACVTGIAERAERALLKQVQNKKFYSLLSELIWFISHREQPYHIMHVWSHTELPRCITEGNRRADLLAMAASATHISPTAPHVFQQARRSHAFFPQNAPALVGQVMISRDQAKAIVSTCPNCQSLALP